MIRVYFISSADNFRNVKWYQIAVTLLFIFNYTYLLHRLTTQYAEAYLIPFANFTYLVNDAKIWILSTISNL